MKRFKTVADLRKNFSFRVFESCSGYAGAFLGIISFALFFFCSIFIYRWFFPQCPRPFGRECNYHGTCTNGICYCDTLFSGISCSDTQIPAYNAANNSECNGNGFANPFIIVPSLCKELIINGVRISTGTINGVEIEVGWGALNCSYYVQAVRDAIAAAGDPSLIPSSATIPLCICSVGFRGFDCSQTSCPYDESGAICGGRGNTSVGFLNNYTTSGIGCQCNSPVALFDPAIYGTLTPAQQIIVNQNYYFEFFQVYCGVVYKMVQNNETVLVVYTPDTAYSCFCQQGFTGPVCKGGQCEFNPQTNEICYGRGHRRKGQNLLLNTTQSTFKGTQCDIICDDGQKSCGGIRCVYEQTAETQYFNELAYCINPYFCPADKPVRCASGECVKVPEFLDHGCINGYEYGSIDHGQIGFAIAGWICNNITNPNTFNACFLNTTDVPGVMSFPFTGGVIFDSAFTLTLDFGSPLVYYQISTNASGIDVVNWDGQVQTHVNADLVSGIFDYSFENQGDWINVVLESDLILTNTGTNQYSLCPMPWNYTAELNLPANFSLIRVISSINNLLFVFEPTTTFLNTFAYTNESYVLVKSATSSIQTLYYHPIGLAVQADVCLSNPAECSWYLDRDSGQLRSLVGSYYICEDANEPVLEDLPCMIPFTTFVQDIPAFFFAWTTCVSVVPLVPITIQSQSFNILERNYTNRETFPFTIIVYGAATTNLTILNDIVFLTLDRITYPCACQPAPFSVNETVLNDIWFGEETLRNVRYDQITIGDYVLAATYDVGYRRFVRGQVAAFNPVAGVITVANTIYQSSDEVYDTNIRTISSAEFLEGTSDTNLLLWPYRCPDGSKTTATSTVVTVNTTCNCTLVTPIYTCDCRDAYYNLWGCECSTLTGVCICGLPATADFELDMWQKVNDLTQNTCQAVLVDTLPDYVGTTSQHGLVANGEILFNFSISQIPTHLVIFVSNDNCSNPNFNVSGGSFLFSNITVEFDFASSSNVTCEFWLTLYMPEGVEFSIIRISSNNTDLLSGVLLFSINGYSLTAIDSDFVFTASSNTNDAANVNVIGSEYWVSSGSVHEIPTFIQVTFDRPRYIDFTIITFYLAGSQNISNRFYLQGYSNQSWYNLGNVGVHVAEGGWGTVALSINETFSFQAFRIICPAGRFGIRTWQLYANQLAQCSDGTILVLDVADLSGLKSISVLLQEIEFHRLYIDRVRCFEEDACNITIAGVSTDVSNNGECEDLLFIATEANVPLTLNYVATTVTNPRFLNATDGNYSLMLVTNNVLDGISSVQFTNNSAFFINETEQREFFTQYLTSDLYPNLFVGDLPVINLTIYYFFSTNNSVIFFNSSIFQVTTFIEETVTFQEDIYEFNYGDLETNNQACPTGLDVSDCGPSSRSLPRMQGYRCELTLPQATILNLIENGTSLVYGSYYVANLSELTTQWSAEFFNIEMTRNAALVTLDYCKEQVCSIETPFKCANGECVVAPSECNVRYDCPGNGCIEQTDAASGYTSFRCACALHSAGDGCQYQVCVGATPHMPNGIPASETCKCGGDNPFREKPPIVNYGREIDTAAIIAINNRITGNSVPRSPEDVDYHRVMPNAGPWGRVLNRKVVLRSSDLLSTFQQTIWTDCPCLRKGYRGEHIYLTDDVLDRNPLTGAVTLWRTYVNPSTNAFERFIWKNICTYDDFPYRCKNGQCEASERYCANSEILYPLCNGRGTCMADSSCKCTPPYTTFSITEKYTETIAVPYPVVNGQTEPTLWVLNFNSLHHGLNQCTKLDCSIVDCTAPSACFGGTPSLAFADALVACPPSSGRSNRCAPSIEDCTAGINLQLRIRCNGRGIPRVKDFTSGEEYCACGTPISSFTNISQISQLTQLKKDGWGGPACDVYFAQQRPIIWSIWDWEVNQPYRSAVTGLALPGKWVSGDSIVGPNPDNPKIKQCCIGYTRLEDCPNISCRVQGESVCKPSIECIFPDIPEVEFCNGHGTATADGECSCDISEENGSGYIADLSQFSVKGCYKLVQCPLSQINGQSCRNVNPCTDPGSFKYPMTYDIGLEEQWYSCIGGRGLFNNVTILNEISASTDQFKEQAIQGLSAIALDVIADETAVNTCDCQYPDDTFSDKYGMVPGSAPRYFESYKSPYYLWGNFTGYPLLTDGSLEGRGPDYYTFITGSSFHYELRNNATTYLAAILIFGKTLEADTQVSFSSNAGLVCTTVELIDTMSAPYKEWITSNSTAHYCGPSYTCFDFEDEFGVAYRENCQILSSIQCTQWKRDVCNSQSLAVYWPLDSQNQYQGCSRTEFDDQDLCTCCTITSAVSPTPVSNGIVTFTVISGSVEINQIQVYGYTNNAIQAPSGLIETIQVAFPSDQDAASCQDLRFYQEYLNDDKSPYSPLSQQQSTFEEAFRACNDSGGVLAVTTDLVNQDNIELLQRVCKGINPADNANSPNCTVNARDIVYDDRYVNRSDMFQDGCTMCYKANTLDNGYVPISFSTFPGPPSSFGFSQANYRAAIFPNQVNAYTALVDLGAVEQNRFRTKSYYTPRITETCTIYYRTTVPGESESRVQQHVLTAYNEGLWTFNYKIANSQVTLSIPCDNRKGECVITRNLQWTSLDMYPRQCANINFMPIAACGLGQLAQPINNPYAPVYTLSHAFDPNAMKQGSFQRCYSAGNPAIPGLPNDNLGGSRYALCQPGQENTCVRYTPFFGGSGSGGTRPGPLYQVSVSATTNRVFSVGSYGVDIQNGLFVNPFLPVFLDVRYTRIFSVVWYADIEQSYPKEPLLTIATPVYLVKRFSDAWLDIQEVWQTWPGLNSCQTCYKTLRPNLRWLEYIYHENTWPGAFDAGKTNQIFMLLPGGYQLIDNTPNGMYTHQTTYIESQINQAIRNGISATPTPLKWRLSSCVAIGASGFQLRVCDDQKMNFICNYDWVKFTVQPGTQCPACGTSLRTGGDPTPGVTCFDEFPLANTTLYPTEHLIKRNYIQGTLDLYAESYNLPADLISFGNTSIIFGFVEAWLAWKNNLSNRPGQATRGISTDQNWCAMSVALLWPEYCGIQRDPTTNKIVEFCAANAQFCSILYEPGENALVPIEETPPVYGPVDPEVSKSSPSCGYIVDLSGYFEADKYGAIQDNLDVYSNILKRTSTYVQFQFNTINESVWYNAGKTNTRYVFEAYGNASISGRYLLEGCESCVNPYMVVFLHPLNVTYELSSRLIPYYVSLTNNVLSAYEIDTYVTETDTGQFFSGGDAFPEFVFRGVGYRFYNVIRGASVYLYNPVITDIQSRSSCENRNLTRIHEPNVRIQTTSEFQSCVLTDDDLILFPGANLGDCACALPSAGTACDYPAVTYKYGKEVCGGFGDAGVAVVGFNGQVYTTGVGVNAGGYILGQLSDCKTIDIGRAAYTLLTPKAIWDYVYVAVETAPFSGTALFINPVNSLGLYLDYDQVEIECQAEGAHVPYYYTGDELNQLARSNLGRDAVFIGTAEPDSATIVPWTGVAEGSYFVNGRITDYVATEETLDCSIVEELCLAINANNYAYATVTTGNTFVTNGNTIIEDETVGQTIITWDELLSMQVKVYVFATTSPTIDCYNGGACTTTPQVGVIKIFICRCPSRQISIPTASDLREVQIFNEDDTLRSSVYSYI